MSKGGNTEKIAGECEREGMDAGSVKEEIESERERERKKRLCVWV